MAKYLVTAKIEVETISGPDPAEYQVENNLIDLLMANQMYCSVDLPENKFEASSSIVINASTKAKRI